MVEQLRDFAQRKDHSDLDSIFVVVFTDVRDDTLLGCDELPVHINDFLACFSDDRTPALAGKPKIFVIQAIPRYGIGW